jgi:large subunit ribosomal protein L9
MEIILLQDVPGIGKKNDLLLVGDGFALNFLLPQNKALVATPTVRRRYAEQIKRRAEERETEKKLREGTVGLLKGKEVLFERKITKAGSLYAAITAKHITEALKKQHGIEVAETAIDAGEEPIKELGSFDVKLKVGDVEQPFTVKVVEEK